MRLIRLNSTLDHVFENVCDPNNQWEVAKYNGILLGILLGYGRNNAIAFYNQVPFQQLEGFKLHGSDPNLSMFLSPGFFIRREKNDDENLIIQEKMQKAQEKMEKSFNAGSPFETFVDLLTGKGELET